MQGSILTEVALPLLLAIIMFGVGSSLTIDDFTRLMRIRLPVYLGLAGQLLGLPLLALGTALAFDLSTELAIGLMILSACPGGTTSNVLCHVLRGNLALSVTLTALTTLICVLSTPVLIGVYISLFAGEQGPEFSMINTIFGLILITLLPVSLGMLFRHHYPFAAIRHDQFFRRFSMLFMLIMIAAISWQERTMLQNHFFEVVGATLSLNLLAIALGLILGIATKLPMPDSLTLGIEVGVQNATMAILIAIVFLDTASYAITPGIYGITMYIGVGLLALIKKQLSKLEPAD